MIEILANLILAAILSQFTSNQPQINVSQENAQISNVYSPQRKVSPSIGVKVSAQSLAAADENTLQLLYEKNSKEVRSIASITKLMTALVFLETNPDMEKEIIITKDDYRAGNRAYFFEGERVKVKDLFSVMLIASANEGSAALVRSTGLTSEEFIKKMNDKAQDLGMTQTIFADETGLNNNNKSTASDILKLAKEAFNHDEISSVVGLKNYQFEVANNKIKRSVVATDKILGDDFGYGNDSYRILAGKTGYLDSAGYCFASKVTNKDGDKTIIVVLGSSGSDTRFNDTKSIAYWVYNNYIW